VTEQADVTDPKGIEAVIARNGVTAVVHSAAIIREEDCRADPSRAVAVNVGGTGTMLEAARRHGLPLVYVSTCAMYGHRPDLAPLNEDMKVEPYGIYDTTKRMAELLVEAYHAIHGVDAVIVRTGFVYGPGQEVPELGQSPSAVPVARGGTGGFPFLDRMLRGMPVVEPAGGDQPFDWTYVRDLAEGIFLTLTVRPLTHRTFNITGGRLYTLRELAGALRRAIPNASIDIGPGLLPGRHLRGACDLVRARAELGYEPRYPLERGVHELVQWLAGRAQTPGVR
jgi:nucleoside-diphosphate-sugar epimerase